MNARIAALLTLVVVLAGCSVPGAPRYADVDPQASVVKVSAEKSGMALRKSQTVGVIFTENTVANLAYLDRYHTLAENSVESHLLDPQIKKAYVDSSDPALAIDWFSASLQGQFASVDFYADLDELMAARPDVIVLLDSRSQLVTSRSSAIKASIVAEFFDAGLNYIGKAEGHAGKELSPIWAQTKRAPQIAAEIDQQRSVQVDALQQFDVSLGVLINTKS
jgi:hypothetical protein